MVPSFEYGSGPLADARLGFASALLADCVDVPPSLASPALRRFAEDAFARLLAGASSPDLRAQLSEEQTAFDAAAGDARFDPRAYATNLRKTMAAYVRALEPAQAQAFVIGGLAAQIAYNARVLRQSDRDRFYREALASDDDLDAATPGLADLRAALVAQPAGEWSAIAAAADRFAAALLGTSPVLVGYGQPASSTSVWTILVRTRTIAEDGPRKDTQHAAIDIVYGDGTHRMLGAYPDGKYAFGATGGALLCGADLEPDGDWSTIVPVALPSGIGYDELAQRLLDGCTAFNQHSQTYDPLAESAGNDNTFVVGLLRANGVDTSRIIPEAQPSAPAAASTAAPAPTTAPAASPAAAATASPEPTSAPAASPAPEPSQSPK